MDVNQLLFDHQRATLHAQTARSEMDRATYVELAGFYASRIHAWRKARGIKQADWPQ